MRLAIKRLRFRKSKRQRTANAPFRLASLPNRKQHALPTITAITKKRGLARPNGNWDSQGKEGYAIPRKPQTVNRKKGAAPLGHALLTSYVLRLTSGFSRGDSTIAVLLPICAEIPWRRGQHWDNLTKGI